MATLRNPLAASLALAVVLATGACDRTKNTTDVEFVQKAKAFQEQGKLDSAAIELKNALYKNPRNAEARLRLGEVYASMGLGERAENELRRAKELGIDEEALKVPLGQAIVQQRDYSRALKEAKSGSRTPRSNVAKLLDIQANAHIGLGNFDEGCNRFQLSHESDGKYIPAYWGLARCAMMQNKPDESRTLLQEALKVEESNAGTWSQLGNLERATRRWPEAETAYSNALKFDSGNVDALLGRALIEIETNRLNEAQQDVDAAGRRHETNPVVNYVRGVIRFKQGQLAEAKTLLQTALRANPDYLPAVLWLGLTNFAHGDNEQAAAQFRQYAQRVPNTNVNALLALTEARLGRRSDAQQTLRQLGNVDVNDPKSLALLAQANMSIGENEVAAKYWAKAIKERPEAADLRVAFAETLARTGNRAEALQQLESAVHLDSGMLDANAALIQNLIRDKQFDKALTEVEALEAKQPKNSAIANMKGTVYLAKDDAANARKNFERALTLDPPSMAAGMNLAQMDLRDKKPELARERFQVILAKDGKNVGAMIALAAIAAATSQESEFVAWLEKAAKAGPSISRPRVMLARYYLEKNDARQALLWAGQANDAEPNNFEALDALGTTQLAVGENQNAVITYRKLANRFPNSPMAHFRLATAQVGANDVTSAEASLKIALALKPDYLEAEILLGSIQLGTRRYPEALQLSQRIQEQYPKSAAGFVLQGDVMMAQRQFAPALKVYEKALALNDSGLIAIKVHMALTSGGDAKGADARLAQWLKDHPGDVNARGYFAASSLTAGRYKQSIDQYELVLQIDAKNARALNDLAWLYQQEKDPRALATAEQAYQMQPSSPQIMDTLGWILVEQNKPARAAELLQKAAQAAPASTTIRYHWAAALAKSGDNVRARAELADLLTKNKTFPERKEVQELLKQLSS
jgi:putative PEP-CTERM system TPR-repeat lipoprotein